MHINISLPVTFFFLVSFSCSVFAADVDELIQVLSHEISGNRARDYTMRLWQYDKWSTLPMWQRTAKEAQAIMKERGFDEAVIVDTPADGITQHGTWTNPIGWDCKQATLEVIEPEGIPEEFRYLCNYRDNPTSLNNHSCPTPLEGIETELVLLEQSDEKELAKLDARGKIILVSSGSRGMKKHLDPHGALGIVSDEIEADNKDFVTANQWLNGWSDMPGGWQMNASDSRNNFGFSISQRKGAYLRDLLRQGKKVKVRAKIDSRYFTDDSLQYVVGSIKGTGDEGEDILIVSHIYEWGANDDCTGASSDLEVLGTLNDLIKAGKLPRPKRTIRMWLGFEKYGSMAYAVHNLERLRSKTIAAICCDTSAENFDFSRTAFIVTRNFNACPSFTDAVYPDVIKRFHDRYFPNKLWKQIPFASGLDNFFGDPAIGVPLNAISTENGGHLHHNSMDTIDKVDPRTLHALSVINAAYMYYLAAAGYENIPDIARLTTFHSINLLLERTAAITSGLSNIKDGNALGKALSDGVRIIEYYTGLYKQALQRIEKLSEQNRKADTGKLITNYQTELDEYGQLMVKQFKKAVDEKSKAESIKIVTYKKQTGNWEQEAETIIPKRTKVGTLTLEGIPSEEWAEVTSSPRWWSATNWATASYFWCDGKRNLNQIKELLELEAGVPVNNFDLIKFYKFLEKYDLVEFMQ
ncbi:MAG: hypothetical protein JXB48_21910 [Candidatus Latescibacteria bacterium]|nr:hypothetical protein [Candidatus Latescibacterota bacterium]